MRIGIMGAMPEEIDLLVNDLSNVEQHHYGQRIYHSGTLCNRDVVMVFSRWGKVASASTVTTLLNHFQVEAILFTGVAGAAHPQLNIGDIVIADMLIQHDMNAAPLFKKHEIPLLGCSMFETDKKLKQGIFSAAKQFVDYDIAKIIGENTRKAFNIVKPTLYQGKIASGDEFVANKARLQTIGAEITDLLGVDMESAAVAQVCFEHQTPFAIVRTISDRADHAAPIDFARFISEVARHYSHAMITSFLTNYAASKTAVIDALTV